eukprot:CAMPEP_0206186912 /NCGR_PEP_ID=MMETSP0166-20121206/2685_1 /ASSEMBLY_ACC=CAM_ASM_000260 /TAXON_ID=95228 /ORGANISM="Vannella robusta, Strain DIVA3 518/3/11/1/6" /LENGTH=283 /DNA_ID=CAMNT_0053602387 /DNA_START=914 /DNA_END=1762 /DNA_ORIENTATION=-
MLGPTNALELTQHYDVIVDCSDNATTRYLLNDIAVLTHKPLISGSAIGSSGQVSVFHYRAPSDCEVHSGCYRCVFSTPSPITQSCSDFGVLGPVTGMIGCTQAMEVLKVLMGKPQQDVMCGRLLMVDLMSGMFRTVKYPRKRNCIACGDAPAISLANISEFLPIATCEIEKNSIQEEQEISCKSLHKKLHADDGTSSYLLIDVRNTTQFKICSLPKFTNIPLSELSLDKIQDLLQDTNKTVEVYIICRRGIDSTKAVHMLNSEPKTGTVPMKFINIQGGLEAW